MLNLCLLFFVLWLNVFSAVVLADPQKNSAAQIVSQHSAVSVTAEPAWRYDMALNLLTPVPVDDVRRGIYYHLIDAQTRVSETELSRFRRIAMLVVNDKGLQTGSQVTIDFDPSYQDLKLHRLVIWRDGKRIDKLGSAKMDILQREEELEDLIYNGDHSLSIIIDDVRVGDIIDYSYSIDGNNPVFQGHFSLAHYLDWSDPVGKVHRRVFWQRKTPLYFKFENAAYDLKPNYLLDGIDYVIEKNAVPASVWEADMPIWFPWGGAVYFSDVASWQEVTLWGTPLFAKAMEANADIKLIAADIQSQTQVKSLQVAKALQYVQSKVRYMGIEFGQNSHKPSNAAETLARHYGDCKDKVVLLNTILQELGITAYPALVNTEVRRELANQLPRMGAFDHVISYVELDDKAYWLDPTRGMQNGDLSHIYQKDYEYGLILDGQSTELTPFNLTQPTSTLHIKETFELFKIPDMKINYHIESVYTRLQADNIRRRIERDGLNQVSRSYLDYYRKYYPNAEVSVPMTLKDDVTSNTVTTQEQYVIKDAWTVDNQGQGYTLDFEANQITPNLTKADDVKRQYPLYVSHPQDLKQTITLKLDDIDWSFDDEDFVEDNPFFIYRYSVRFAQDKNELVLEYSVKTKTEVVMPQQLEAYRQAVDKVRRNDEYSIRKSMPSAKQTSDKKAPESDIWPFIASLMYLTLLLTVLMQWFIKETQVFAKTQFYPMSLAKLSLYWLLSGGMFGLVWLYRQWDFIRQQNQPLVTPLFRAVFAPLWLIPLHLQVFRRTQQHSVSKFQYLWSGLSAVIFTVGWYLSADFDYWPIFGICASMLAVLPLAMYINGLETNQQAYVANSRWNIGSVCIILVYMPILLFYLVYWSRIGLLHQVVTGDELWKADIKYLQRHGVLEPGDKIRYFYSDHWLDMRQDGNGFSQRAIFSYWREAGELYYASVQYNHLKALELTEDETGFGNDIIKVIDHNDEDFLLYLPSDNQAYQDFYDGVMKQWQRLNPEGYEAAQSADNP